MSDEQVIKFHVTWLCGGESMMLTPLVKVTIDLIHAAAVLKSVRKRASDAFVQFDWKGVQITLYRSGSMHFHHFVDVPLGSMYAQEVLSYVSS